MKKAAIIAALVVLAAINFQAGAKTIVAKRTPLSEVLKQIDQSTDSVAVSFAYESLEDYTVTETINTDNIVNAVFKAIGFYPVKVTVMENGKMIAVAPRTAEGQKIIGRVTDENGAPVEYATVRLFSITDSTFIGSGVSNTSGDFVVTTHKPQSRLSITAIGYVPLEMNVAPGNIGILRLQSNPLTIKEVLVTADYIVSEGGKITTRPTLSQLNHSMDIFSLLSQMPLPGVYVDPIQRAISAYGENPIILIDGVERNTNSLLSIRLQNVSRIEYITDIPAKYIARRPPVVINIILKEPQEGGSAWANAKSAVNTGFIDADAGGSYNQGKSEFSLYYGYSYRDYNKRVIDQTESYIGPDTRIDIDRKGRKSPFDYNTHNIQAAYTYRHSESAYLTSKVDVSSLIRHADENADVFDNYSGDYVRHSQTRNANLSVRPDIYFQKDWNENGKLEIQAAGNISNVDYTRNLTDTVNGMPAVSYPSQLKSSVKSIRLESSYEKYFGRYAVNLGYRFNYSRSRNDYILDNYRQYLRSSTNSVYGGVAGSVGEIYTSLKGSVGFVNYPGEEKYSQIKKPTVNFNLYLWKSLSNSVETSLSAEYWTTRPSLTQITDYVQRYDGYLLNSGNPGLKIQRSYSVTPNVRWQKDRLWAQINLRWLYNWNPIYSTVDYLGNGEFLRHPVNGSHNFDLIPRFSIGANQIFKGHFSAMFNFTYRHQRYVCQDGTYTLNAPEWVLSLSGYYGDWMCQFILRHPGRNLYGPTVSRGENDNELIVMKSFGSHWKVFGSIMYFLTHEGTVYPSSTKMAHYVNTSLTNIWDNHAMVVIGLRYNGAFGRIFKTGRRSLNGGAGSGDYKVVQ
ncbi:MAG: hypothetical protein HDR92_02695 [Bacteroides sp.]|nr:hypothetical protein [Bacteroides sp.]